MIGDLLLVFGVLRWRTGTVGRIGLARPLVVMVVARVIIVLGRGLVRRGIAIGRSPIEPACRFIEPALVTARLALADEPRQFRERIIKLGARRNVGAARRNRIPAITTEVSIGHDIRPESGVTRYFKPSPASAAHSLPGAGQAARRSPHLVWSANSEQPKPGREYGGDALYEDKPPLSQLSIILDNEA